MKPLTIRNDMSGGWIFFGIYLGGLLTLSWIYLRDGGFGQVDLAYETAFLILAWILGLGLMSETVTCPSSRFTVHPDVVVVTRQWLWKRSKQSFDTSILNDMKIRSRWVDSDPIYRLVIVMGLGDELVITHSMDRKKLEAVRSSILAMI